MSLETPKYCKDIDAIKNAITAVPDFPKKGILFRDLLPIFHNHNIFSLLIRTLSNYISDNCPEMDFIIALEARGFLIGPALALKLGVGFIPIRKAGKLPGPTLSVEYSLEYGVDRMEIQQEVLKPGQRVVIIDDLLATGGTMAAACELVKRTGADVLECLVVAELPDLDGRRKIACKLTSFVAF